MQFKKGHVHKFITENREKIGKYLCTQYRDTMHDLKKKRENGHYRKYFMET